MGNKFIALWKNFERGDHLSDEDIKKMIKQCRDVLEYLDAHNDRLLSSKIHRDLTSLLSMVYWRKVK